MAGAFAHFVPMGIRRGVVVGLVALAAAAVACGAFDKDDPAPGTNSPGSGAGDGSAEGGVINGNPDPRDAASDRPTDAPTSGAPARLFVVNGVTDLGPSTPYAYNRPIGGGVRICYGIAGLGVATRQAYPSVKQAGDPSAAIGMGRGQTLPMPLTLQSFEVIPYLVSAEKLDALGIYNNDPSGTDGPPIDCRALIEDGFSVSGGPSQKLVANVDYWKLTPIPSGTLRNGRTYVLALTGCAGDSTYDAARCGPGFATGPAGVGTLQATVLEVDPTPPASPKITLQYVQGTDLIKRDTTGPIWPTLLHFSGATVVSKQRLSSAPIPGSLGTAPPAPTTFVDADVASGQVSYNYNESQGTYGKLTQLADAVTYSRRSDGTSPTVDAGHAYAVVVTGDPTSDFDSVLGRNWYGLHALAFDLTP